MSEGCLGSPNTHLPASSLAHHKANPQVTSKYPPFPRTLNPLCVKEQDSAGRTTTTRADEKAPKINKSYANSHLLWSTTVPRPEPGIPAQRQQSLHRLQMAAKGSSEERRSAERTLEPRKKSHYPRACDALTTRVQLYL